MISYPGDCAKYVKTIQDVVNKTNADLGQINGVVFTIVDWTNNALPETNLGAQNTINKQLLDSADIIIGLLWTKMGTPTEEYKSGTEEEIVKAKLANKDVLLLISNEEKRPNEIDTKQLSLVRKFVNKYEDLYKKFDNVSSLQTIVRDILTKFIQEHSAPSVPKIDNDGSSGVSIEESIDDAINDGRFNEALFLHTSISSYLWYTGKYSIRHQLGIKIQKIAHSLKDINAESRIYIEDIGNTYVKIHQKDESIDEILKGIDQILFGIETAKNIKDDKSKWFVKCRGYRNLACAYADLAFYFDTPKHDEFLELAKKNSTRSARSLGLIPESIEKNYAEFSLNYARFKIARATYDKKKQLSSLKTCVNIYENYLKKSDNTEYKALSFFSINKVYRELGTLELETKQKSVGIGHLNDALIGFKSINDYKNIEWVDKELAKHTTNTKKEKIKHQYGRH